ncbi:hypothetical protein HCBG_03164 [Histoplasma capsulatum G186AR]|uniref:Uncharacterized protein n=2 Tax=Ajellomyces capsulatus TaxID=5037 RepID=C0NJ34_AJECG|nr:uncharacterized protein HCBG_03164 [Histoplasma capsulatum G186AR]EEH07875.1 hypothetical protein HCBG_03164 [Histoplasma capsulatum G186AR]
MTPQAFPQLGGAGPSPGARGWDQQGAANFGGGPGMPSAGGYGQQLPGGAAGYGRGQSTPASGWAQPNSGSFGNGFGGYQP